MKHTERVIAAIDDFKRRTGRLPSEVRVGTEVWHALQGAFRELRTRAPGALFEPAAIGGIRFVVDRELAPTFIAATDGERWAIAPAHCTKHEDCLADEALGRACWDRQDPGT